MVGVHASPSSNHPSVHLGCFCILAVVSPGMRASLWKWNCWVIGSLIFSILRTLHAIFSVAAPFCILISSVPGSSYCCGLSVFQLYFTAKLVFPHGAGRLGAGHRTSHRPAVPAPASPPLAPPEGLELTSLDAGRGLHICRLTLGISFHYPTEICFTTTNYVFQINWIT